MTAVAAGDSRAKKMKENKFYFSETFANFNAFYSVKGFYLLRNVLKTGKAFSILPFVILNSVIFSYVTYLNAQSCNAEGSGMCDPKSASENVLVKSVDYFCEIPTGSSSTARYTGAFSLRHGWVFVHYGIICTRTHQNKLHWESKNWTLFHLSITFTNTVRF